MHCDSFSAVLANLYENTVAARDLARVKAIEVTHPGRYQLAVRPTFGNKAEAALNLKKNIYIYNMFANV